MTLSASRQQEGLGQRHGFISILAEPEDVDIGIANQSPPYFPPCDLPSCPASELVTPELYAQACADDSSGLWLHAMGVESGGLISAGTFGDAVGVKDIGT